MPVPPADSPKWALLLRALGSLALARPSDGFSNETRHTRGTTMTASKGFVVPAGGGKYVGDNEPDRFSHLKLLTEQTNGSIMMFEQTVPPGTASCRCRDG